MVDTHCHLTDKNYAGKDIEELTEGLDVVICNGTSVEDSQKAIEIANKFENVYATVGVHPDEITSTSLEATLGAGSILKELAKHPKVVAIGEAALDYYDGITEEKKELQRRLFNMQVEMATETRLPLVVHNRNADEEILERLNGYTGGVQLHCFVENWEYAQEAIKRGWYMSFGGVATFKKSDYLKEIIKKVPAELILVETDSPYLAPEPIRGTVNKPKNAKIIMETIAQIRNMPIDKLDILIRENVRRLFNI